MEGFNDNEKRVAALCRRLGTMWTASDEVAISEEISEAMMKNCELTLYGKLMSKPNINFAAFWSTMKKAWRAEQAECVMLEPGFFSFKFKSVFEKNRVLEEGPWCFSRDLLVLQQCEPDTPDHCYNFTKCAFWIHLKGIPRGRLDEEIIKKVANVVGPVTEVKIDTRGTNQPYAGKARVVLDVEGPLKSGTLLNLGYKKLWVEFHYERLPKFCYSCGCMGHFTIGYEKIPYVEENIEYTQSRIYGGWLRAEVHAYSPFWQLFYGESMTYMDKDDMEMERSVERPTASRIVLEHGSTEAVSTLAGSTSVVGGRIIATSPGKDLPLALTYPISAPRESISPNKSQLPASKGSDSWGSMPENSKMTQAQSVGKVPLMITEKPWKEISKEEKGNINGKGKQTSKGRGLKKQKRFSPYAYSGNSEAQLNEGDLLETPIQHAEELKEWARVASPNKPPGYQ